MLCYHQKFGSVSSGGGGGGGGGGLLNTPK